LPVPETQAPAKNIEQAPTTEAKAKEPDKPPLREPSHAEFEKFLIEAPYNRDIKSLLRLVSEKAAPFARPGVIDTIVSLLPHIILDSKAAGLQLRGALVEENAPSGEKIPLIALSPGPLLLIQKGFLSKKTFLLPDSPSDYALLDLPPKELEAARKGSVPVGQETGEWGLTRVYADGSRRGEFSHQQQAGLLLGLLARLDLKHRYHLPPYAAELYARTVQRLFFAQIQEESHDLGFLDPELRLSFQEWLDRPGDDRDHLVHVLSARRVGLLDPDQAAGATLNSRPLAAMAQAEKDFRIRREAHAAKP
jgi:hypothetical protein